MTDVYKSPVSKLDSTLNNKDALGVGGIIVTLVFAVIVFPFSPRLVFELAALYLSEVNASPETFERLLNYQYVRVMELFCGLASGYLIIKRLGKWAFLLIPIGVALILRLGNSINLVVYFNEYNNTQKLMLMFNYLLILSPLLVLIWKKHLTNPPTAP